MDTPRYDSLLRALAFKLRDPVAATDGNEDGKIFKLDSKANYINRGYGAMRRKVGSIVSSPEKIFPDFYLIVEKDTPQGDFTSTAIEDLSISLLDIVEDDSVFDINDIYLRILDSDFVFQGIKQATWIDPESYIAAKYGTSQIYKANDEAHQYFWSVINGNIVFIAENNRAEKAILFLKNATPQFSHAEKELIIPREYNDFLLTCAAYEAMIDLGDNKSIQKAVMYDKWLKNELEIMMIKEKIAKSAEDDRTTK